MSRFLLIRILGTGLIPLMVVGWSSSLFSQTLSEAEAEKFFVDQVKPILKDNCWSCHADDPQDLGGNLALTSPQSLIRGGESGPAVDLESHLSSLLVKAINYEEIEMPPDDPLSKGDIATLTRWVELGLPWPESEQRDVQPVEKKTMVTEEAKRWWSFQRPVRAELPLVSRSEWCQNEIDRFVLAKLDERGFEPAVPASRASLIRRAYYDLTGLAPTFDEVQSFANDPDPQAYEKLLDRLLDSPHYGEKWARHWLDLVRYAESNSFERDGTKPFVWRYRDYVIQSLNADKPYDLFLKEQLAGDEMPNVTADTLIATGYYRVGQWDDEPADPELARFDGLDDILATTSQTMLGLTVNCARCHDHKIDPIATKDYYQMLSMFNNIRHYGNRSHESVLDASVVTIDKVEFVELNAQLQKTLDGLESQISEIEEKAKQDFIPVEHQEFNNPQRRHELIEKRVGKTITAEEFSRYNELVRERRTNRKKLEDQKLDILCVKENGPQPIETHVMVRGNAHVTGERVDPGFISVLSPPAPQIEPQTQSSGRRLALANWIASPDNPLTARVMANRLWQYHFGRGIVRTSSDFGFQGSPPTHPELLDWLACELVEQGWHLKALHKKLMLSSTYQMSSAYREEYFKQDPENNLMWRFDMRRLSGEEIRDSVLAASQQLNRQSMFGRSVFPKLPQEVLDGQSVPGANWDGSSIQDQNRRSIYVHMKRSLRVPLLANFDAPDSDFTCPVRFVTTQPTQALGLINSDFMQEQSKAFCDSLGDLEQHSDVELVEQIWQRALQRNPNGTELEKSQRLLETWIKDDQLARPQAIQNLCLLALNLNEFVYLD